MRDLVKSDKNVITIFDQSTGTRIHLFYRSVTTEDRLKYNSSMLNMITKTNDMAGAQQLQLQWGKDLITGFADGDLAYDGKPISSNPDSPDYYAGWKGLLEETGSDLLMTVSKTLLGEPNFVVKDDFFLDGKSKNTLSNGPKKDAENS